MTPVAGRSERTSVLVIRGVATDAAARRLELPIRASLVAFGARHRGMLPGQRKRGLAVMIECPELPALGIVAACTILPKAALVKIILRMTIIAGNRRVQISLACMAASTIDRCVPPQQRKFREVVIEPDCAGPALDSVALTTSITELAFVRIVCPMAAGA